MCTDLFCSPLNSLQKRSLHISPHYFIQGMNFAVEDFAGAAIARYATAAALPAVPGRRVLYQSESCQDRLDLLQSTTWPVYFFTFTC